MRKTPGTLCYRKKGVKQQTPSLHVAKTKIKNIVVGTLHINYYIFTFMGNIILEDTFSVLIHCICFMSLFMFWGIQLSV